MKELFSLLEQREKKVLAWLAGFLAAALAILLLVTLGLPGSSRSRAAEVRTLRRQSAMAERERVARAEEVARWEEARQDVAKLRAESFYAESGGINELRLDLQSIFSGLGREAPDAKFDYADLEKEKARKVSITFNFDGSYTLLKRFLAEVEKQDRFLVVERVIFLNIETNTGNLLLKVTLAAYYAV